MAYTTKEDFWKLFPEFKDNININWIAMIQKVNTNLDFWTLNQISPRIKKEPTIKDKITKAANFALYHLLLQNNYTNLDGDVNAKSIKIGDLTISNKIIINDFILDIENKQQVIREIGSTSFKMLFSLGLMNKNITSKRIIVDIARRVGKDDS